MSLDGKSRLLLWFTSAENSSASTYMRALVSFCLHSINFWKSSRYIEKQISLVQVWIPLQVSGFYVCAPRKVSASVGRQVRHPFCFQLLSLHFMLQQLGVNPLPLAHYQRCSMNVHSTRMQPKTKSLFRYGGWGPTLWLLALTYITFLLKKKKAESRKWFSKTVEGSRTWHDEP